MLRFVWVYLTLIPADYSGLHWKMATYHLWLVVPMKMFLTGYVMATWREGTGIKTYMKYQDEMFRRMDDSYSAWRKRMPRPDGQHYA